MSSRFVRPETTRLELSQGDWLIVKQRLNVGEYRAMHARLYQAGADGQWRTNLQQVGIAQITAYLLDWSLTDDDGKPVVIRDKSSAELATILESLDIDSFTEIRQAIDAHEAAMDAARTVEKKTVTATDATTSRSPSAVAGLSRGSVN